MSSGFSSGLPQLHFTDGCPYPSTSTAMPACSTDRYAVVTPPPS